MRNLNGRQRIALAIAIAAMALVVGKGVERRFIGGRGGWFAYTPDAPFYDLPGGHGGDILVATAWWLVVVAVAAVAALWVLRDPPSE